MQTDPHHILSISSVAAGRPLPTHHFSLLLFFSFLLLSVSVSFSFASFVCFSFCGSLFLHLPFLWYCIFLVYRSEVYLRHVYVCCRFERYNVAVHRLHNHHCHTFRQNIQFFCRTPRKINYPSSYVRTSVRHLYNDLFPVFRIRHFQHCSEFVRSVRAGQAVMMYPFATACPGAGHPF